MSYFSEYLIDRTNFFAEGGWFAANEAHTITIAAKVVNRNMIEIAVAYCRDGEIPDLAIGECAALDKFLEGQTILIKNRIRGQEYKAVEYVGRLLEAFSK